jgi:hypothetical protein
VKRNGSLCTQSGSTLCMSSSFLLNMGNISHLIHSDMAEIRRTWALHGRVHTDSESKILNWKSLEETYSALHNGTWVDRRLGWESYWYSAGVCVTIPRVYSTCIWSYPSYECDRLWLRHFSVYKPIWKRVQSLHMPAALHTLAVTVLKNGLPYRCLI